MTMEELLKKTAVPRAPLAFNRENTVLLLIDMQELAGSEYIAEGAAAHGADPEEARRVCEPYARRVETCNRQAGKLLEAFRARNMTPIHVRIESYSGDGRDVGPSHRRVGFIYPPGDRWAAFMEAVAPLPGEIVLSKTCSGCVVGTNLDKVLRNLNAKYVVTVGYYTDQCVETTVRDLHDLGYDVTLALDATATPTEARYDGTMKTCVGVYCRGLSTDDVLAALESISPV